eukprot:scaffold1410_cov386-Prasinococcus_capsulatus_cf.AAC.3
MPRELRHGLHGLLSVLRSAPPGRSAAGGGVIEAKTHNVSQSPLFHFNMEWVTIWRRLMPTSCARRGCGGAGGPALAAAPQPRRHHHLVPHRRHQLSPMFLAPAFRWRLGLSASRAPS